MKKRVVITGIGIVTANGYDVDTFYRNLLAGKSAVSLIEKFDTKDSGVKIAGEIKDFDPLKYFDKNEAKRMDLFCQYGLASAIDAVENSKLDLDSVDPSRIGVITASGIGGMNAFEVNHQRLLERGPRRVSPLFIPMMISDILAGRIAIKYGFKGPNFTTTSACASSGHAIGTALRTIQYGDADIMICGGSESVITPTAIAGFANMKAITNRNDEPEKASRPFDKERNGFVMGEGAAMFVIEEYQHAKDRGATIYAELKGVGFTCDAYDIVMPDEEGEGAKSAMLNAMKDGEINPKEVGYINTHGTSTPKGDIAETIAVKKAFGEHAQNIVLNSTKSMIGHLLGASGAVELVATIMALRTGKIHPTINLDNQDEACDLNYAANQVVEKDLNCALCNTFGFGGHNASILIKKIDE